MHVTAICGPIDC